MSRICFRYAVGEELKFLSHLDLMRLFHRALRRSMLPMDYTKGYSPHPRLNLAAPLPVGATAAAEYGEIFFTREIGPDQFLHSVRRQLPEDLTLTGAACVAVEAPPLAAVINAAAYEMAWWGTEPGPEEDTLKQALQNILDRKEIIVARRTKSGKTAETDIRPFIFEASLDSAETAVPKVALLLQLGGKGGVSPYAVLELLDLNEKFKPAHLWRLHRRGLYIYKEGELINPLQEGGESISG